MKCLSLFANVGIGETYFDEIGVEVVETSSFISNRDELALDCA